MSVVDVVAILIWVSLALYLLFGGADFGAGFWYGLSWGPRRELQRRAIDQGIAPVWEANHVWLIVAIVLVFTGFPPAYALISTALHYPLTLLLVGIVLRGAAWVFHFYDPEESPARDRWRKVFFVSSTISPVFLGVVLGALTAGRILAAPATGAVNEAWVGWFPLSVGLLCLSLSAMLAAVYLSVEAEDPALKEDFSRRASAATLTSLALAAACALALPPEAGAFRQRFFHSGWTWPLLLSAGAAGVAGWVALNLKRYRLARLLLAFLALAILAGWGLAQYPYLVTPALTLQEAAAPRETLLWLVILLAAGSLVLVPSLMRLFRVFKHFPRS